MASGKKYFTCALCGAAYDMVEIVFTSGGITAPVADETLTGATSGATAIVDTVKLISGAWGAGTAAGIIWCTSPSVFDSDTGHWGTSGENINGSTAGDNCLTMTLYGNKKSYGRYYSEDDIVERDGTYLCLAHNSARWNFKDKNEQNIEIDEGDRE